MPSRGLGSTCTRCQSHKVKCSLAVGCTKRRLEGEPGGSVPKRPRRDAEPSHGSGTEERKVQALEAIALGLDRLTLAMERLEDETRTGMDLAALHAFKESAFPLGEWDRRECFADYLINESEKWVQDKLEGKDVEGEL